MKNPDSEIHLAGLDAYNRWLSEGFCAADPARLFGVYQIPNLGVETAVAELKKAKDMGYRGAVIGMWPSGKQQLTGEDDPFWAAGGRARNADLDPLPPCLARRGPHRL